MDREMIINYDKGQFFKFLKEDYDGKILELFNDEGIELLKKYEYIEERICYILCFSRYNNELMQDNNFLDLFFSTDISQCYASLRTLNKNTYDYIIKRCIELGKDNTFISILFSYFNSEYKINAIDNWSYSTDLLYELFKIDMNLLGPKIIEKYNIDLMSHDINIAKLFEVGRELSFKDMENRNLNNKKSNTLNIPVYLITSEMASKLWNNNNIFIYRKIINDAFFSTNPIKLNEYAKKKEEENIIFFAKTGFTKEYNDIYNLILKVISLSEEENEEFYSLKKQLNILLYNNDLYELFSDMNSMTIEEISNYLKEKSNQIISNYIIDYHFEENYYNIIYDLNELLNFYYAGNINLSQEKVSIYNQILHIDELLVEDKIALHEQLKKYNIMEMFYDDMSFAREIVREAIKDYSLTKETLSQYRDDKLSNEYGVDVYNIKNNPFFAIVKSGRSSLDKLPTGHSYSLVGSGCIATFEDPSESNTFIYDAEDLNSEQIVHVYPMDSFTLFKPFCFSEKSTRRVQTLMMPDELLDNAKGFTEILILEQGLKQFDMDKRIPELKKMALYCVDKITSKDVEKANNMGVGIFLVNSKDYHKGYDEQSNIYRHNNIDYRKYNYFDESGLKEHENRR